MSLPDGSELLEGIQDVISKKKEREEKEKLGKPLSQIEHLKQNRMPKGKGKMLIAGVPVDVFAVEDFVLKASAVDVDSLLSFDRSRFAEMIRNNKRPEDSKKMEFDWTWILFIIIAGVVGLLIFMFLPKIMSAMGGFF